MRRDGIDVGGFDIKSVDLGRLVRGEGSGE